MNTFQDFLYIMDFIGNQTVQGPKSIWSCTETLIWNSPFGSQWSLLYGENPGKFSSKTLISFQLKKESRGHLGW